MSRALFDAISLRDVHRDLLRNVKGLRISQDLYDDLSADPRDWPLAIEAQMRARPVRARPPAIIHRPFEQADYLDAVRFPFDHWARSRFSSGRFGVWYGSAQMKTTIHETVYHWMRMLRDSGFDRHDRPVYGERRVFRVRCEAALLDLRPLSARFAALVDPDSYRFTQGVGARVHREGHPGLINGSARCEGDVYALFTPKVLSKPRNHCDLTYHFDPTHPRSVRVERTPGRRLMTVALG